MLLIKTHLCDRVEDAASAIRKKICVHLYTYTYILFQVHSVSR